MKPTKHPTELTIKPAEGLIVRCPSGALLAKDGETVKRSAYWIRRLNDGSVVEIKTLPKAGAKPKTSTEDNNA